MVKQETFNFQNKVQVLDGPVVTMDYVPYTITVEGKSTTFKIVSFVWSVPHSRNTIPRRMIHQGKQRKKPHIVNGPKKQKKNVA